MGAAGMRATSDRPTACGFNLRRTWETRCGVPELVCYSAEKYLLKKRTLPQCQVFESYEIYVASSRCEGVPFR